jgi:hypothetical protein
MSSEASCVICIPICVVFFSPELSDGNEKSSETTLASVLTFLQNPDPLPFPNSTFSVIGMVQFVDSNFSQNLNFSGRLCPQGFELLRGTGGTYYCHACRPGTYLSYKNGQFAFCEACPIGRYSQQGAFVCSLCPAGYASSSTSSAYCEPCNVGSFNSIEGGPCLSCMVGTFTSQLNSTFCSNCYGNSITANLASSPPLSMYLPQRGIRPTLECSSLSTMYIVFWEHMRIQ